MNKNLHRSLIIFTPLFIAITLLSGLIYWSVQQNYRLSANDPQIQTAQDGAQYLKNGGPADFSSTSKVEMSQSLASFILIYDQNKKLVTYSGVLHGKPASVPSGVLDNAKRKGEVDVTWQPESGTRIASVVVYYKGIKEGYVVAGRSLKEVEKREQLLAGGVFLGWVLTLLAVFSSIIFLGSNLTLKPRK